MTELLTHHPGRSGSFQELIAIELGLSRGASETEIFEALKQLRARVLGDPDKDPMADE